VPHKSAAALPPSEPARHADAEYRHERTRDGVLSSDILKDASKIVSQSFSANQNL